MDKLTAPSDPDRAMHPTDPTSDPISRPPADRLGAPAALVVAAALGALIAGAANAAAPGADPGADPGAGPSAEPSAGPSPGGGRDTRWGETPLEIVGEGHRVREGYVAGAAELAADAERAATGTVIGASPALDALARRSAERGDAAGTHRAEPGAERSGHRHGYADVWLADVGVLLRGDRDGDGFFGSFELSIDVDTDDRDREVYAAIELSDGYGGAALRHDTASFAVYGSSSGDEYRVEFELLENHPAGYRDLRIEIRDAYDGWLLDEASAHTFSSLAALPLESEEYLRDDGRRRLPRRRSSRRRLHRRRGPRREHLRVGLRGRERAARRARAPRAGAAPPGAARPAVPIMQPGRGAPGTRPTGHARPHGQLPRHLPSIARRP